MTVAEIAKERREEILRIAARHGASNVRVLGSAARGEDCDDDDCDPNFLDLLVTLERGRILRDVNALREELDGLLPCDVGVVSDDDLPYAVRDQVLDEAVAL